MNGIRAEIEKVLDKYHVRIGFTVADTVKYAGERAMWKAFVSDLAALYPTPSRELDREMAYAIVNEIAAVAASRSSNHWPISAWFDQLFTWATSARQEKPKPSWCSHWTWKGYPPEQEWVRVGNENTHVRKSEAFCHLCGAKRPGGEP